jgi:putative phage-type endonuclease
MKELNYPQRSEEWFNARLSKITGSKIADLMPGPRSRTKYTQTQLSKLMEIAAENLTGIITPTPTTAAMQWGIDHEEEARDVAEIVTGMGFRECGFFLLDEWTGASPDGVNDTHVLELKCPGSKKHLSYLLDAQNLIVDYEWQVYTEMLCTGRDKAYLMSYDPRFIDHEKQYVIVEIEAQEEKMELLKSRLAECIELLEEWTGENSHN